MHNRINRQTRSIRLPRGLGGICPALAGVCSLLLGAPWGGGSYKSDVPQNLSLCDIYQRSRNQSVRRGATKVTEGVYEIEAGKFSNPRREVAVYKAGEFRCPNCGKLLCCVSGSGLARGLSIRCRCHTEVWIEYGGAAD